MGLCAAVTLGWLSGTAAAEIGQTREKVVLF
jgi:hypothetical protein